MYVKETFCLVEEREESFDAIDSVGDRKSEHCFLDLREHFVYSLAERQRACERERK